MLKFVCNNLMRPFSWTNKKHSTTVSFFFLFLSSVVHQSCLLSRCVDLDVKKGTHCEGFIHGLIYFIFFVNIIAYCILGKLSDSKHESFSHCYQMMLKIPQISFTYCWDQATKSLPMVYIKIVYSLLVGLIPTVFCVCFVQLQSN